MVKKLIDRFWAIIIVLCFLISLSSCFAQKQLDYYSQRENYISITGTVTHIKYNSEYTALYYAFDNLTTVLSDNNFKIVGENLEIVQENGIADKIKMGSEVTFITAPRYFGDGYIMPIVGISVNGETLLEFEDGYTNLLKWLES